MNGTKTTDAKLVSRLQSGERLTRGGKSLPTSFLEEFVALSRRYSIAEKLVLGDTQVTYSPTSLKADLNPKGNIVEQGEKLAVAERERHSLSRGPILEIDALIEDQGLKVIARRFPAESTSLGAFFFDGDIGPTIFLDASASNADRFYVLARLYGHFLADYEPYPYIVCGRPDPESFDDVAVIRAHTFALAFLMPESDINMYREALGLERNEVLRAEFVEQLQTYFEVDAELILWRLLSLEWVSASQLKTFLQEQPTIAQSLQQAPVRQKGHDALPDRLVQLVAHGFGGDKLNLKEAAGLLGVNEQETISLLGQFRYDESGTAPPTSPSLETDDESIH